MINVPMKQARRHSELTKHQREPLIDHFKECSLVIQKRQNQKQDSQEIDTFNKEDYNILFKTIANTNFYHRLAQKFGDQFSKTALKHLKYERYQKGDLIVKQGTNCLNTYFILSGVISVQNTNEMDQQNLQQVPNFFEEQQLFNKLSIGSSFGYLPNEITMQGQTYQVFSQIVELAVIDINSLREIKIEADTQCNSDKLKFFKEQMQDIFEDIDKKTAQLFIQLIKEIYLTRGDLITSKITQPNQLCVISKGQIMSDYGVEIQHQKIKDDGIDVSETREIKRRNYCTQILVRGDVFTVNVQGDKQKDIAGTHLKIKEKLVCTSFITQVYYLDDLEYENILKKLRNDMRFEILVEDDNLKFSQKVLKDFMLMHQRFSQKQKELKNRNSSQVSSAAPSTIKQDINLNFQIEQDSDLVSIKQNMTVDQKDLKVGNDQQKNTLHDKRKQIQTSYQFSRQRRNTINVPSDNQIINSKKDFSYNVDFNKDLGQSAIQFYFDKQDIIQHQNRRKTFSNNFSLNQSAITEANHNLDISTIHNNSSFNDSILHSSNLYQPASGRKVVVVSQVNQSQFTPNNKEGGLHSRNTNRYEQLNTEPNLSTNYQKKEFPLSCKNSTAPKKQNLQQQMLNQLGSSSKQVQNLFQLQQQMSQKRNRAISQFVSNLASDYGHISHISTESHEDPSLGNGFNTFLKRRDTNNSLSSTKKIKNGNVYTRQNSSTKKSYNLYGQFDDELENLLKHKNQILKKCKKDQKEFDRTSKLILKTYETTDVDYLSMKKKQILDQANKEIIKKRVEEKENMHNNKKVYKKGDHLRVSLFGDMSDVIRARVSRMFKNGQNPLANSYV